MKKGQIITSTSGDKKGLQGEIIAIDAEKNRIQVKWPKGFMKTWIKITSVK
jgi:ribosomal protein L24